MQMVAILTFIHHIYAGHGPVGLYFSAEEGSGKCSLPVYPESRGQQFAHEIKGKAFFVDLTTFGSLLHYVAVLEHFLTPVCGTGIGIRCLAPALCALCPLVTADVETGSF